MSGSMSPLLMQALMAGGGAGGVPQDPAVMAAMPRLQLAQAMMQEGMSGAPTSKWGAFGRVGQALAGNYMFGQANTGLQQILQQRQAQSANMMGYLGSDTPQAAGTPPQAGAAPMPPPPSGGSPVPLAGAVHQLESSGSMKPGITGDGGAAGGPMQVHQAALDDVNKANGTNYAMADIVNNPPIGKWAGDQYLALQQKRFPGRPDLALAAYNAGPTATTNAVQSGAGVGGLPPSTQSYVQKGMALAGGAAAGQPPARGAAPQNPQIADAMDKLQRANHVMLATAADPYNPANAGIRAAAQAQIAYANTLLGLGEKQTTVQPNGIMVDPFGRQTSAATPTMNYQADPNNPGMMVSPGQKPVAMPTPRAVTDVKGVTHVIGAGGQDTVIGGGNPSGVSGNTPEANAMRIISEVGPKIVDGSATPQDVANYNTALPIYQASKAVTTTPGQTVTQVPTRPLPAGMPTATAQPGAAPPLAGPRAASQAGAGMPPAITPAMPPAAATGEPGVVVPPNPDAIARQAQAQSQGSKSGEQAAITQNQMINMGGEATRNISNIQNAINQLNSAQTGGLTTGYFGPKWGGIFAVIKGAGVDTSRYGVDPDAIGNFQAGAKGLAVISGNVLRTILGEGNDITDAKLAHFIHATPGLETDPGAIQKILGWAMQQSQYNLTMAHDAMAHADPNSGIVPPSWQTQFHNQHGFGPIYDPQTKEVTQPEGMPKAPELPAAGAAAPLAPGARVAPDGKSYLPDPARAGKYLEVRPRGG